MTGTYTREAVLAVFGVCVTVEEVRNSTKLARPRNWQDFEKLTRDYYAETFDNRDVSLLAGKDRTSVVSTFTATTDGMITVWWGFSVRV